jgi:hypothetical protein
MNAFSRFLLLIHSDARPLMLHAAPTPTVLDFCVTSGFFLVSFITYVPLYCFVLTGSSSRLTISHASDVCTPSRLRYV